MVTSTNTITDEELVARCKRELPGNTRSYELLVQRHMNRVYSIVYRLVCNKEEAEDITQEVFMVLMREAGNYDQARGSVNAFLLGIARNHVLRRLKRERRLLSIDEATETTRAEEQLEDLSRREAIESLQKAVLSLPEHYREVVVLCELQEMSYAEAATVLGCAIGTVRSRLHRARTMLIERLRPTTSEDLLNERLKSARCFA